VTWRDRAKAFWRAGGRERLLSPSSLDDRSLKHAFDSARVGVQGLAAYPSTNINSLVSWHRRNELVYACVRKIAEAALDPEPIVERAGKAGQWTAEPGHSLRRLLLRPNEEMDGAQFLQSWLVSEQVAGAFYAEIVRGKGSDKPVELWPLDPAKMAPVIAGRRITGYEWKSGGETVRFASRDILCSRLTDISNRYHGLAPLGVALGSVEADSQQTDYVRAFFQNAGVPSGIIKIKGRALTEEQARKIQERWVDRYGWGGEMERGPAVLDENADYQKIGSDLSEIESQTLRAQIEARICAVFGVPPLLVGAFVGLLYVNQRGSAKESQRDFWMNTMSPLFKRLRTFLTWTLLPEWEGGKAVLSESVRVNWDMDQVMALQEEIASRSQRAREDFRVGLLTLNQALSVLGYPPRPDGDYYLRRVNQIPITPDVIRRQLEAAAGVTASAISLVLTGARRPEEVTEETAGDAGEKRAGGRARKSFDWDGVACWREPNDLERKANVRATGAAMDAGRAEIEAWLLIVRGVLIAEAVRKLAQLAPRDYHKLVLDWPQSSHAGVRDRVERLYVDGRALIRQELQRQRFAGADEKRLEEIRPLKGLKVGEVDETALDRLAEATISRVLNDVQARAAAAAAHLVSLVSAEKLQDAVRAQLEGQSTAFLSRAASEAANVAVNLGRAAEGRLYAAKPKAVGVIVEGWVYTSVLDARTCDPCTDADGMMAELEEDLPMVPNPECGSGYGACRCIHIPIVGGESDG